MPTHFFVGTLLLYAVVLGTFLLSASPLQHSSPNWRTVVPIAAGVSFYVAANLFLLILGRGQVSRWTVLNVALATLIISATLSLALRSQLLYERVDPNEHSLRGAIDTVRGVIRSFRASDSMPAQSARFAGMIALEEAIKLLPVFFFIRRGRIRTAHAAMLGGALSGLTFGTIEAISYGYLVYPELHSPVTTYLTRFFIMSPLHGIWDSLAGGLVFFLSGRRGMSPKRKPMIGAALAAYACAVVFHVAHNSLQVLIGPAMQIVTVFTLLAPLYMMAKVARRRAAAEGAPDGGQLVGDLHILTVSLATLFLAVSVAFSWALGIESRHHTPSAASVAPSHL
jgi:RsiW-degrading membrane proteinase PrsW (M82 family)